MYEVKTYLLYTKLPTHLIQILSSASLPPSPHTNSNITILNILSTFRMDSYDSHEVVQKSTRTKEP